MTYHTLTAFAASFLLAGCGTDSTSPASDTKTEATPNASKSSWILASAPVGAISVTQAKAQAKEGDEIVIRGRIGGRHSPMQADSTVFTIVDLELKYCGQESEDNCPFPWDYCCETPETLATNTATVQVLSDTQLDLTTELEPRDVVILRGIVGPRPNEQVLTVKTNKIYAAEG